MGLQTGAFPDTRLSSWLRHNTFKASLLILLCSMSVRLYFATRIDAREAVVAYSDSSTYLVPAETFYRDGTFMESTGGPMVSRTPGYPVFLATLMHLVGQHLTRMMLAQAVILSFTVLLLYWMARRIAPPVVAFCSALVAAASPWSAVLAGIPMSDGPFVLCLILIFLAMRATCDAARTGLVLAGGIGVGLMTGASVMVRPLWPLVVVVPVALGVCYGMRRPKVWMLVIVTLISAALPVELWRHRNRTAANFNGISDIPSKTAWRYLAARVIAESTGRDRHEVSIEAYAEDARWKLTVQQAEDEHWRRSNLVFRAHPFITLYSFLRSALEHAIHPSPDVLLLPRISFRGDFVVLGVVWGMLLILAAIGFGSLFSSEVAVDPDVNRVWLLTMLSVCSFLTLMSGISFAAGSRLRAPLELIVPLIAVFGARHLGRLMRSGLFGHPRRSSGSRPRALGKAGRESEARMDGRLRAIKGWSKNPATEFVLNEPNVFMTNSLGD